MQSVQSDGGEPNRVRQPHLQPHAQAEGGGGGTEERRAGLQRGLLRSGSGGPDREEERADQVRTYHSLTACRNYSQ